MGTPLIGIISDLRTDIGDENLDEKVAERAIIRSLTFLSSDVGVNYTIFESGNSKEIQPVLTALHQELLLLRALAHLVMIKQSRTAVTVSFKSGDKQVRRSATGWKQMEKTILDEYYRLLKKEYPSEGGDIFVWNVKPVRYSSGSVVGD